ncbi:MAG TPA: hypothetical protein VJS91_11460, partial [Nitrososphaeraceae archaeon]|nr:hypothetical protein [Nitrososphaeraceae archaeon]
NNTNPSVSNTTDTNSVPNASMDLTNFDIPSMDITLPDGSSVSPDFSSIFFSGGSEGDIYAYYNDYGLPENKPKVQVGDEFTIDAYPLNANTPKPSAIQASISRIVSGGDTGNFTAMKLDQATPLSSSGNTFTIPTTDAGSYILNVFVRYPTGGIVPVYTLQMQIAA